MSLVFMRCLDWWRLSDFRKKRTARKTDLRDLAKKKFTLSIDRAVPFDICPQPWLSLFAFLPRALEYFPGHRINV